MTPGLLSEGVPEDTGEHRRRLEALRREVVLDPRQVTRYLVLAQKHSAAEDVVAGARAFVRALVISKPDLRVVQNALEQLMFFPRPRVMPLLWRAAEEAGSYPHEELLERAIATGPEPSDTERRNYLTYLFRRGDFARDRLPYVICGMPKSASTFISGLVAAMTGLPIDGPHNYNEFIPGSFDKGCMWDLCQHDAVVHGHLAANPRAICYLRLLKARPIITVRNIFDALRSYVDQLFAGPQDSRHELPDLLDHAVLRGAAFYVDFYASWVRARPRFETLWINYEEIRADPHGLVDRLAAHVGGALVPGGLDAARRMVAPGGLDAGQRKALMVNQGVSGRGRELSDRQKAAVRTMYKFYRDVDFREIDPEHYRTG
jgi:hypothetical protein